MFDPHRPTLRYRIDRGDCLGVIWLALGSVALVEIAARQKPNAIVLDCQHGVWERRDLEAALGAAPPEVPVMVRVAENGPLAIGEALDAGAERGIVVIPMIETTRGVRNAGEIAAVEGINMVLIGTGDLALSIGTFPRADARHEAACSSIHAACRRAWTPCGVFTVGLEAAERRRA